MSALKILVAVIPRCPLCGAWPWRSPLGRSATSAASTGRTKHSVFPEPVPVVTTTSRVRRRLLERKSLVLIRLQGLAKRTARDELGKLIGRPRAPGRSGVSWSDGEIRPQTGYAGIGSMSGSRQR